MFDTIKTMKSNALTLDQIKTLPTTRILAYYKSVRWMWSAGQCECCGEYLLADDQARGDAGLWYTDAIREVLNGREHVHDKTPPPLSKRTYWDAPRYHSRRYQRKS